LYQDSRTSFLYKKLGLSAISITYGPLEVRRLAKLVGKPQHTLMLQFDTSTHPLMVSSGSLQS